MKYISLISVLFFLSVTACNRKDNTGVMKQPGEVAVRVFEAITSGDTELLRENLYISNKQQREAFFKYLDIAVSSEQYKENVKGYVPSYSVVEEDVKENDALVVLSGVNALGERVRISVKMLKIDGAWKVDGDHAVWQK